MRTIHLKGNKRTLPWLILFVLNFAVCFAQNDTTSGNERVFALRDFEEIVLLNHPVVKQAGLLSDEARAKVQQAWGDFDPALKSHFGRKVFG